MVVLGFVERVFNICSCQSLPPPPEDRTRKEIKVDTFIVKWLIEEGFFPASPGRVRNAYSIQLLRFIGHLLPRSGIAVHAIADAMKELYAEEGLYLVGGKVSTY